MTDTMNVLFISLGCDKNLVDSERMLGSLARRGYGFTNERELADIAIVNTCCFINDAKEESIQAILEVAELKKTGRLQFLIVTGCLAQRYQEEIHAEIEEVDAVLGTAATDCLADVLDDVRAGRGRNCFPDLNGVSQTVSDRRYLTTGGHYAHLKIAEGCDKHCTYCIIPQIRGRYRSVPVETLLAEAEQLAADGVKELILVAQETTLYGVDLYGKKSLPLLLRKLCGIEGLKWIRILYCYPEEITDELIETIKSEEKICHYLDIPIQHASDSILGRMGRKTSRKQLQEMIEKLRREIPDICLRTTLVTGFPGETQADYETLYRFVNEMEFDRLGVFPYSREEDTAADLMPEQIAQEIKECRRDELMELQQAIVCDKADEMLGQELTAMIEGKIANEDVYVARTYRDAPNVDGYLFVSAGRNLETGDFVKVLVTDSREYDLIGELAEDREDNS